VRKHKLQKFFSVEAQKQGEKDGLNEKLEDVLTKALCSTWTERDIASIARSRERHIKSEEKKP
jgi:hypothetical protein